MAHARVQARLLIGCLAGTLGVQAALGAPTAAPVVGVPAAQSIVGELSQEQGASASRPVAAATPTDRQPRPPGQPRNQAAADRAAEGSGAAAAALWDNTFVRTTLSLALVLCLILGLAVIVKAIAKKNGSLAAALGASGPRPAGLIEVLGRYPIGRGQTLILLKLERRVLLVGQTASRFRGASGGLVTLCEIGDPESVAEILARSQDAEHASITNRFQSMLHRFDQSHAAAVDVGEMSDTLGRAVTRGEDGDTLELLDERSILHRFPDITHAAEARGPAAGTCAQQVGSGTYGPAPQAMRNLQDTGSTESYGSIRERLHALRGEAHR